MVYLNPFMFRVKLVNLSVKACHRLKQNMPFDALKAKSSKLLSIVNVGSSQFKQYPFSSFSNYFLDMKAFPYAGLIDI